MAVKVIATVYGEYGTCSTIFDIRKKVFVEEQKVDEREEFDEYESNSVHYLGVFEGIPVGTARWRITQAGIKLERFAVLKQYRNHGVAAAILKKVLADTFASGVRIYLHAQITAVGFYEKYGFIKEGSLFTEAGIDHFRMVYRPTSA